VLLPDIEGIDTAHDQVRIATAKAGLRPGARIGLERFEIVKLRDADTTQGLVGRLPRIGSRNALN
jgi:hypothetical protein